MTTVKLTSLRFDRSLYPRQDINQERINEFIELMMGNVKLPPIKVTEDGLILDGIYRFLSACAIGRQEIEAEVMEGGNVRLTMASLNSTHGLPLTSSEKQRVAVEVLKADPKVSLDEIAKSLSVSRRRVERWTEGFRSGIRQEKIEMVKELRAEGRTESEIGEELRLPQQTVSDLLNVDLTEERRLAETGSSSGPQDDILSHSEPLADTKSPEVARMKANLRPLQKLLDAAKDARCPDHGNETITFACGLPLEEAVNRFASQLRLLSKHLQDMEAARP